MLKKQKKRNLFSELTLGLEDIKAQRNNKLTLRTCNFISKPAPYVDAQIIRETREKLNMSRSVFALKMRTSLRTLEKWEQGNAVPNDQAAALIMLVRKYPDTLTKLEHI